MNKAMVYAKHKFARTSVKKMRPVMDLVRGKKITEAKVVLTFDATKASKMLLKVLNSAIANAKNNLNLSESKLYISDLYVNEGPTQKRHRFASRANVNSIFKRSSHIVVGLSERGQK